MSQAAVTVLMPVYNAEPFLREAIDSILNQTFTDFEFVIINDGSSDRSEEIIKSYTDPRIRYYKNEQNLKLIATLNKGIDLVSTPYIARMDADDISSPGRLERQVLFMNDSPDLAICGSWVWIFTDKKKYLLRFPVGRDCVGSFLLFGNPLAHPAVIMKQEILNKMGLRYDPVCSAAQDFDLWSRCWPSCAMDNIPQPLIKWRQNPKGVTSSRFAESNKTSLGILKRMLNKLEIAPDNETLLFHREIGNGGGVDSLERLSDVSEWLTFILKTNENRKVFPPEGLRRAAAFAWYRVCLNSSGMGIRVLRRYMQSSLRNGYRPGKEEMLYFLSNALLKYNRSPTGRISSIA